MSYTEKEIHKLIKNNLTPWLIKSSGRVLGPFSRREIEKKLKTRELVALDEVAMPLARWRYLKDQAEFIKVVEEVRIKSKDNEQTMTATTGAQAALDELTATVSINNDDISEKTPDIRRKTISRAQKESSKERLISNAKESVVNRNKVDVDKPDQMLSYGYSGDRNIKKKAASFSRFNWLLIFSLILIGSFILYEKKNEVEKQETVGGLENLSERGLKAKEIGEFRKAGRLFKKHLARNSKDIEIMLELMPLSLVYESDFVFARKKLQDIISFQSDRKFLRDANALMGLANLLDERGDEQTKEFLEESLKYDSSYLPARLNMAALQFLQGKFFSLIESFQRTRFLGSVDGAAIMMVVQSYIKVFERTNDNKYLEQALSLIDKYIFSYRDYRQEFLLAKLYIRTSLVGEKDNDADIESIIDMDPFLTEEHRHDPSIYREHMNWEKMRRWCDKIHKNSSRSARDDGLYALCLVKSNETVEAERYLNNALTKKPDDTLLMALQSYYFAMVNNEKKALGLLSHVLKNNPSELSLVLMGRFCGDAKSKCASDQWQNLLKLKGANVSAMAGIVDNLISRKQYQKAKGLNDRGLSLSATYKPFMKSEMIIEKALEKRSGE